MFGSDLGAWATVWSSGAMTVGMVVSLLLLSAGLVLLLLSKIKKDFDFVFGSWIAVIIGGIVIGCILMTTMNVKDARLETGITSKIEEKYHFKVNDLYDSKFTNNVDKRMLKVEDDHVFGIAEGKVLLEDGTWYDSTYKFNYKRNGDITLQMDEKGDSIAPKIS